jgi:ribosome-binding factor A
MGAERDKRVKRIAEGIREELATLLSLEVRDPGAAGAVVTRVDVSEDLRTARVYVRALEGGAEGAQREGLLAALARASGMLRTAVTQRLGLRYAPQLRFFYDDGSESSARVEQLLAEIDSERRS